MDTSVLDMPSRLAERVMIRGVVVKAKNLCSFNEARLLGWLLSSVGVVAIGVNWGVGPTN